MWSKPYGILAMNPDKYREIDGVVFDLASYAKHCQPLEEQQQQPSQVEVQTTGDGAELQNDAPTGVFAVEPFHDGWYPANDGRPPVPIMGGALPSGELLVEQHFNGNTITVTRTVFVPAGSGSGSGSYMTSYTTSYTTSYRSSGSGSYVFGSCTFWVGGYGLELV